ncbi:MAG: rhamnan synthesis F family protein [Novosphingobium sp.]
MKTSPAEVQTLLQSGLFEEAWYVERYPDVLRCRMSPAEHYLRVGRQIGRMPNRRADRRAPSNLLAPSRTNDAVDAETNSSRFGVGARHGQAAASPLAASYEEYQKKIFAKIDSLSHRPLLPVDVEIDTDYTGPVRKTPFHSFHSEQQREDSARQIARMLQFGIVAINPRPGVHAARHENGDFIRYRSIRTKCEAVKRLAPSMLIHIHAFYPEVLEEMLDCFVGEAQQGRFFVTTTTPKNYDAARRSLDERGFGAAETVLIENKGRDIGPFLDHAVDHASDGDVICHVHTKKSPELTGGYGEKWRKSLFGALLTQTAVDAFADARLGLLFPDSSRSVGWGKNRPFCEKIAANLNQGLNPHPGPIPAGNMFFARVEVARAMRDATGGMDWPREPVPYDGSVLHAIERMWPTACEKANLDWAAIHAGSD